MPSVRLYPETGSLSVQATPASTQPRIQSSEICARLYTTSNGKREALLLSIDRPLIIGRHSKKCSYVIPEITVSGIHCKIYAIQSSQGGIMVSCEDLSSNGSNLNGQWVYKTSFLMMDGDTLKIGSKTFVCQHAIKPLVEKMHVFDPTPPQQLLSRTKQIGRFLLTSHCLGSGSFATVNLALDSSDPSYKQVACKIIRRKKRDVEKIEKEGRILTELSHPNINRVYGVLNDESFIYIFLQLCTGGDLFSYIVNHKDPSQRLYEGEAQYIMYQLLLGIKYLHDRKISHRDLKPENILLCSPGSYPRIQIADFGLARRKSYEETFNVCGTVSYLPPEGILALEHSHLGYVGMPADCWSAGVIMYIMLSGQHPFDHGPIAGDSEGYLNSLVPESWDEKSEASQQSVWNDLRVKKRIVDDDLAFPEATWIDMTDAALLCNNLLHYDREKRATIDQALDSLWIKKDRQILAATYAQRVAEQL